MIALQFLTYITSEKHTEFMSCLRIRDYKEMTQFSASKQMSALELKDQVHFEKN